MSRVPLKELAEFAMPMPWEPKPPLSCVNEFREALTPELFLETLTALQNLTHHCRRMGFDTREEEPLLQAAEAVITKTTT